MKTKEKPTREPKERVRKKRAANGTRTQVVMSFRIDAENAVFLKTLKNRSRYINELITAAQTA